MNKWLSMGVATEEIYRDWKSSHETSNRKLKKQLELETKRECNEKRQETLNLRRFNITYRRLSALPDRWFTTAEAAKLMGLSSSGSFDALGGMVVAGHLERNGKFYRKANK